MSDAFDYLVHDLGFAAEDKGGQHSFTRQDVTVRVLAQRYGEVSVFLQRGEDSTSLNAVFEALRFAPADKTRTAYRAPDGTVYRFSAPMIDGLALGLREHAAPWLMGDEQAWARSRAYDQAFSALYSQKMSPPPNRSRQHVFDMVEQFQKGQWEALRDQLRLERDGLEEGEPSEKDQKVLAFLERYTQG